MLYLPQGSLYMIGYCSYSSLVVKILCLCICEAKGIVSVLLERLPFSRFRSEFTVHQLLNSTYLESSLLLSLRMFVNWYCLQLKELLTPSTNFVVLNTNLTNVNATLCNCFIFLHHWAACCSCVWILMCMTAPSCLWRLRHLLSTITAGNQRAAPWWASQKQAHCTPHDGEITRTWPAVL